MSINLDRYTVLSREQFTQEFLPTMAPDGKYFTWEQVNCNERPDHVSATQVWTIYRQDDGSMVAFNRPALGANEVGYVVCAEDLPGGNDLLAARWWATAAQADAEIYRWAKKLAKGSSPKQLAWSSSVLFNSDVLRQYVSDTTAISEERFTEEFRPSMDHNGEYYTAEAVSIHSPRFVWTVFDDDRGGLIARPGRIVEGEPIGYLKTEQPWRSVCLKARWSGPVDFRSNISFEKTTKSALRTAAANGWMSGPTKGSSYRVMEEPAMVKSGPDATAQRLHDLEVGDVSQDEHMEWLEHRIEELETADKERGIEFAKLEARLEAVESTLAAFRAVLTSDRAVILPEGEVYLRTGN